MSTTTCATAPKTSVTSGWRTTIGNCGTPTQTSLPAPRVENRLWAVGLPCMCNVTPAEYSASTAVSKVTTGTNARRTTTRRNLAGRRTAVVEAATVEDGVAAAVQLAVDAAGGLNDSPCTPPLATAAKSVSSRRSTATSAALTSPTLQPSSVRFTSEHNGGDYIRGNGGLHGRTLVHGKHGRRAVSPGETDRAT